MLKFKQKKVLERLTAGYNGIRFQLGSMATGSGFAFGPQFFREDLLKGRMRIDVSAAVSTQAWQKYQASMVAPHLSGDHLFLKIEASRRDYRALEYYGMGIDSSKRCRSTYRLEDTSLQGTLAVKPVRHFRFGGSLGGLWTEINNGVGNDHASTDRLFTDRTAPGLDQQANFLYGSFFGQIDYRDDPAGPKSGGNYVTEYTRFEDRSFGQFSFDRWDVDLQQYVPFLNKSRRFAFRVRMTMTNATGDNRAPFFLQPFIGGSDDLRGFRPYRFTGPNAVVYNAEYRWEIFSGLDGALFFDAGKVMFNKGHLGLSDLEASPGFGFRFNARNRTFIRLDVGFSHEGVGLWLKFNDPFTPLLFGAGTRQPLY
jgi:outer membrane protein assembly factor BamA